MKMFGKYGDQVFSRYSNVLLQKTIEMIDIFRYSLMKKISTSLASNKQLVKMGLIIIYISMNTNLKKNNQIAIIMTLQHFQNNIKFCKQ